MEFPYSILSFFNKKIPLARRQEILDFVNSLSENQRKMIKEIWDDDKERKDYWASGCEDWPEY